METLRQQRINEKEAFMAYKKWAKPIASNMSKRFKSERELAIDDIMQEGLRAIYENGLTLNIKDENQRRIAFKGMNTFSMKEYRYGSETIPITFYNVNDGDETVTIELAVDDSFIMYVENIDFWNSCVRLMGTETARVMNYHYKHNLTVDQISNYTETSRATVYRRMKDGHVILMAAIKLANNPEWSTK
jgi:hypothetical protein